MTVDKHIYIGIDIGGTRCRILSAYTLDQAKKVDRHEFVLTHDYEADVTALMSAIKHYTEGCALVAIGLGVPGDLNEDKTLFIDPSDNLTEWGNKPVKSLLETEFKCPVYMDNDGITAALGEAYYGIGREKSFAFVIWGTGIGGASVGFSDGRYKCETLDWYKYFDAWEQECGGNKIHLRFGKEASLLNDDEWAIVMDDFKRNLKTFIYATSTHNVIVGGGVAIKQRARFEAVARELTDANVQISQLGEDAGLYGALALIKHESE